MEVTLLKAVGDNPEGSVLDIKDETVLAAWEKAGVIESESVSINSLTVKQLQEMAQELGNPEEEWKGLKKPELIEYLTVDEQ